jgi:homoserine O-acetyltransferase
VLHSTTTKRKDNNKNFSSIYLVFLSNISKIQIKINKDLTLENKPTHITLTDFITHNGAVYETLNQLSSFCAPLHTAPIILINHVDRKFRYW